MYRFILALCLVSQISALVVAVVPYTAVPGNISLPSWVSDMLKETNLTAVFLPSSPGNPPRISPASVDVIPTDWLVPLAVHFLQWDVYVGNLAVLVWAGFVYFVSSASASKGSVEVFVRVIGWLVVGGPVAAATVLVWERDEGVYEGVAVGRGKKRL